jgi:hypothetical protein
LIGSGHHEAYPLPEDRMVWSVNRLKPGGEKLPDGHFVSGNFTVSAAEAVLSADYLRHAFGNFPMGL